MAVLVLGLLILAMAGHSSASFCVCRSGLSDQILQKAIDYACGAGADCNPIRPNGQCYNPNTMVSHCSYAVNSYYQKKASSGATCDFGGAATLTNSDPGSSGCSLSATSGSGSTGTGTGTGATGPVTTVPTTSPTTPTTTPVTPVPGAGTGTGTGTATNPTVGTGAGGGTSPYTAGTPSSNGVFGVGGAGLAPTGSSMDDSHAGMKLETTNSGSILLTLVISGIMFLWN